MTTLALYEYTKPGMKGLTIVGEQREESWRDNVVRISEYVEVDFPKLAPADVLPQMLAAVDEQIAEVNKRAGMALAELERRKAELLAITDQREVA